ncbi:Conserved hypothetical protein [Herminiimonas arsenicoxydans]|uniref:Uncharacterized protein n=1 Tax=Herminiimonas arsenicoxydans TaxID=204773 RepID=A4G6E1_HERAR|nr:Conserved hypothetical protein [Herminiimonas arsenicoxydans]
MATAPVSKTANNQPAADKNGAPIRVVTPDQQGNFQLKIGKGDIAKVHIVDVDMVLYLNDGTKLVLAGGAIGAMDDSVMVDFSNGRDSAAHMMDQVGIIPLQKLDQPRVLSTEPQGGDGRGNMQEEASYRQTEGAQDLAAQAQAANAAISALSKAMVQLANVVQTNAQPVNNFKSNYEGQASQQQPLIKPVPQVLPERPGVTPQEFVIGPNAPALSVHLVNTVGTTQDGTVLKGSGGSSAFQSDTNTSNIAQIAPQIINAGNDVDTIWANGQAPIGNTPDGTFSKILNVQITGDGKVQSLTITAVLPAGITIVGATSLGNNVYQIPVSPDTKDYRIELRYDTVDPKASAPIHADFKLNFELTVITTEGIQVLNSVRQVVLKDATTADDLNYANPITGESALVLPAQGISHIVHAGDNAGTTIYGSNANDFLYGGTGDDTLYGGKGNTYFQSGAGDDTIVGGGNIGGTNINTVGYTNSTSGVLVDLNTGNALDGFGGRDTLQNIQKGIGGAHDDTFIVGVNTKGVDGGSAGSDTIDFSASNAAVTVNLATGTGTGGYAGNVTFTNIENVVGSSFSDTFIASNAVNKFDGGASGSNTVSYANSPSSSTSGVTVDLLNGVGSGNDAAGDQYVNIQNVIGSAYNDTFVANLDVNHFDGMGGVNTVSYAGSAAGVDVDFYKGQGAGGNAAGDTYKNIQNVIGSSFDDKFVADTDSLNFNGGAGGIDTVSYERYLSGVVVDASRNVGGIELTPAVGGTPATYSNSYTNIDKFVGTAYADTFIASNHADNFDGLDGMDTVSYAADTAGVIVNLRTGLGSGAGSLADGDTLANIENVIGGSGNDRFVANDSANVFDGGGGSNTVDYSESTTGAVTVDLVHANGMGTSGGFAQGDKYINIQNVTGSVFNDTFIASAAENTFDGGGGDHNRVSYANDTVGVTINLVSGQGSGAGSLAEGDTYFNIQDATGGSGDDTFIASDVANAFSGGLGSNTVSYELSNAGVTVDLVAGTANGGYATGDSFINIQNVKGSTSADIFIANNIANSFIGNGGVDTVSYAKATDGSGVTVDLNAGEGSGGYAQGDRYDGIRNAIGTSYDDTFVASNLANNFDGGLGSNTVSYAASDLGVTVNLLNGTGTGGYADNDSYTSIQNVIGSAADDLFIANGAVNRFDGGVSTAISHNRVSYATDTADLTIDLLNVGVVGIGGNAAGDTYVNIQDVTGGSGDDTFIASSAANKFEGGLGSNTVSYAGTAGNNTIDLATANAAATGTGFASGDTFSNIQNLIGGSGTDIFYASAAANNLNGDGGVNTVDYSKSTDSFGVIVDLVANKGYGNGAGNAALGFAAGDVYTNIQNAVGTSKDDLFIISAGAVANTIDGGTGNNTVSYLNETSAVTVDLANGRGYYTSGAGVQDTLTNIQNATGGSGDDTFIASSAANKFEGGLGNNTVSYAGTAGNNTIDLATANAAATGTGFASGDTFSNIQNLIGGSGTDIFYASAAANNLNGDGGVNTVDYSKSTDSFGVIVDLVANKGYGNGAGNAALGFAAGDVYTNIQNAVGTSKDDLFIISAGAVANTVDGGTGNNTVSYLNETSAVTVDLANGRGYYTSGAGVQDTLTNIQNATGGSGDDTFIASSAANKFEGGLGNNTVSYAGTAGNNTIDLATANAAATGTGFASGDTFSNIQNLIGGSGTDIFYASAAANNLNGDGGVNTVDYSKSTDSFGVIVDLVANKGYGNGAGNAALGFAAGDVYTNIQNAVGTSKDDLFIISAGAVANTIDGGTGNNTVSYLNETSAVTVDLANGRGYYTSGAGVQDTLTNIQNATGGSGDDTFIASSAANKFEGGLGNNTVSYAGTAGNNTIDLATANAAATGTGFALGDTFSNIQNLIGGSGTDIFYASAAANNLNGDGGVNTVDYSKSTDSFGVIVDLVANKGYGNGAGNAALGFAAGDVYANIQNAVGTSKDDLFIISAGAVANTVDGGTGNNTVSYLNETSAVTVDLANGRGYYTSGAGVQDTLTNIQNATGGSGDDTFIASDVANKFEGNAGADTVTYSDANASVTVNLSTNSGSAGWATGDTYSNIENVIGSKFADTLIAAATGKTVLTGLGGADSLTGVSSNSMNTYASYAGSAAGVIVNLETGFGSGAGSDAVGDHLTYIDNLIGSSFDDIFYANTNANIFDGGAGGIDTVDYSASTGIVHVDLSNTTGTSGFYANGDKFINIQNVTGSGYDDVLKGAAGGNSIIRGGAGADAMTGVGTGNYASYVGSSGAVTIDLTNGSGSGADAQGDTLVNIYNVIGSDHNDIFIAGTQANIFKGGAGSDTVSYMNSNLAVTVDLTAGLLAAGSTAGGYALNDRYESIENVIGSSFGDTFFANNVANVFNGGTGEAIGIHNVVSYAKDTATTGVGVTVDLTNTTGAGTSGGFAAGDIFINIQDVIGTGRNDTFIANDAANAFTGGGNTTVGASTNVLLNWTGGDTVSYKSSTTDVVASLLSGVGGTGGYANGDTYNGIENLTGSAIGGVKSTLTGDGNANILTALGSGTTNVLNGGGGADLLDGREGGHNTLTGGAGNDTYWAKMTGSTIANIDHIVGGDGSDTLKLFDITTNSTINMTSFLTGTGPGDYKVTGMTTLDIRDGVASTLQFTAQDVINMGMSNGTYSVLTVRMDATGDLLSFSGDFRAGNGYVSFYADPSSNVELARINTQYT